LAKIFAYLFTAVDCDVTVSSHLCFVFESTTDEKLTRWKN